MDAITCKEAKALSFARYFTGKPCAHGHISERYTSTGNCIACDNERCNARYRASAEQRAYNGVKRLEWARANPAKEKSRMARWDAANVEKRRADNMKRHSRKLQRTPAWADLNAIEQFYIGCPQEQHVDHIIPLQGEFVSGLHVENNLQYLTAKANLEKGNRYVV